MTDALGVVPVVGRGSLPFALVHGESLVAAAAFALEAAGVELLDPHVPWLDVQAYDAAVVLHDPLCPLTPVDFLIETIARSETRGAIVVGCRPVTDTVKEYADGQVGATIDRSELVEVTSPIVLPATVVAAIEGIPEGDFAGLVDGFRTRWPLELVEAPASGRRVRSAEDIVVLEGLSAPH
jgi:2-C-methyl-D-erythritol 4-phosphate cytidylyltransferase